MAGATQERTLLGVGSCAWFGADFLSGHRVMQVRPRFCLWDAFSACQPPGLERLVHRRLVRTKKGDRLGIKERQHLRQEHAGHALRRIDPEEGVGQSGPCQARR
jgi:hypothetical protein